MTVPRLPQAALSLKQFLQRQKILGIYREMLRTIRQVPEEGDRKYLKDWARDEFKRNKSVTNQLSNSHRFPPAPSAFNGSSHPSLSVRIILATLCSSLAALG
uniref:LYR motif-containing protein 2 n=1 Tax=Takifugu rubripes TaxID=31033 RepID=A0A3B5KQQ4_TAKRU